MKRIHTRAALALSLILSAGAAALACTNYIAGKKATTDGSVMVTYAADSHNLYGMLHHAKGGKHAPGSVRKVVEWDTGKPLGEIPEAAETYNVVGNMNEHQVVIAESTWGGRKELQDTTGQSIIDYGSLIYITLERARSAREAIDIMADLVNKYGYASSGESFSIADKDEVWVMELIGKGAEKGAVWMAVRIPDDAISGHANEPRIRKVNLKDKKNVKYSKDVISFARKRGYFTGKDEDFAFADAYSEHPIDDRRGCDARVWSYFRAFDPKADKYYAWCAGTSDEPMPLYIVPEKKVSLEDMKARMRDHYEGTPFDMTQDVGAGPNKVPYRWRPMDYEVDGKHYVMERATATQQTGWSFVAQTRDWLPDPVGGLLWFGTDDANTCVYMPMYCSMTRVPRQIDKGDVNTFDWESNFWMNNWVANQAYHRYDLMIPDIRKVQSALEEQFTSSRAEKDSLYASLANAGNFEELEKLVNDEGAAIAHETTDKYRDLAVYLMVRFMDGNMKKVDENGDFIKNEYGVPEYPSFPGYDKKYYENIVKETGDKFLIK
ncbi:MAG: C69 family dipeptidase [Prevotella sp.]|nr:C69 family dipeptidase [Bacteroides sp.]MCM1366185.1 C69 family dipeptidase [Prevotella sp.]MCM1436937.1 C69 family dipeptidase [Prevotella sp.]